MTPQWRKAELYDPSFSCSGSTTLVVYHTEGADYCGCLQHRSGGSRAFCPQLRMGEEMHIAKAMILIAKAMILTALCF